MPKILNQYRAFTASDIRARADIPTLANMTVVGNTVSCTNIKASEIMLLLGEQSGSVYDLMTSDNINKWSAFSPYWRDVTGTPNGMGNGAWLRHNLISDQYAIGDFAGYNHGAVAPSITSTTHDDDQTIVTGGSATFACDVTIGELKYVAGDIYGTTPLGIAFIIWNGTTYVASQVRDLATLSSTTTFSITVPNIVSTTTYTCQIRLITSATTYTYNPTNVVCGIQELADYTKRIVVNGGNAFADRHALTATYTFVNRQFVSGSAGGAGYYSIQALTGNVSYSNLKVTAWVEDTVGNILTDVLTLRSGGAYTAGQTIVSLYNQNIWRLNGVQLSLPVPSSGLVVVTYFDDAPLPPSGNSYYVSPSGSDSNSGSISSPWGTLQYAFNNISAGATLYVRGGTYAPTSTLGSGDGGTTYCGVYVTGKNGSSTSKYTVLAYPGETPILSGVNITGTANCKSGILLNACSYWYIKGITVTGFAQASTGRMVTGIHLFGGNNNLIEGCVVYSCGGAGFKTRLTTGNNTKFLNCDSHDNYDPYSSSIGGDADGWDIGFSSSDYTIELEGCRAWNNSDDGFDMYQYSGYTGIYTLLNCWSWHNGYRSDGTTAGGDGTGFKYGADNWRTYDGVTRRTTINCIAYNNRTRGFSQESANVKKLFYNNIAYANGLTTGQEGFSFLYYDIGDIVRNNISFGNGGSAAAGIGTNRIADHNSWDSGVTATAADFVSVTSQLANARQVDGSLPVMTFLHLTTGSDLIGKGVAISGLTLDGDGTTYNTPPSMGPFEATAVKTQLTVAGQTITNATTGTWNGYDVARATPTDFIFRYNSITSVNAAGYQLQAGNDASASTNNNLDGEQILGNRVVWNGTDGTSITHGIFTGHMINAVVKYNYVLNSPMAIIFKSSGTSQGMTYTSGGASYNIINNPVAVGVVVKGINGINIYNNTFYSEQTTYNGGTGLGTWRGLVDIYTNTDSGGNAPATNCKIKNNIFYTKYSILNIKIYDNACLTGFESDYNVFYCEAGTPRFEINSVGYTFAQWQALGYDTHSIVVNPNFDNTTNLTPTAALNYGTNLGINYVAGLSSAATWVVGSAPATNNQGTTWQAGARVI